MVIADVLLGTLVVLGVLLALPSMWLLLRALFPAAVERSRDRVARAPLLSFFVGLVPAALTFVLGLLLLQKAGPGGKIGGFLLVVSGFLVSGIGFGGLASVVGERLPSREDEGRPWRALVRGAVCLELSFLMPAIGWFGLLPLAAVTALGAATLALAAPGPDAPPVPPGRTPAGSPTSPGGPAPAPAA